MSKLVKQALREVKEEIQDVETSLMDVESTLIEAVTSDPYLEMPSPEAETKEELVAEPWLHPGAVPKWGRMLEQTPDWYRCSKGTVKAMIDNEIYEEEIPMEIHGRLLFSSLRDSASFRQQASRPTAGAGSSSSFATNAGEKNKCDDPRRWKRWEPASTGGR